MRRRIRLLAGAFAVAALFAPATGAGAETCKLEMKKVDPSNRGRTPLEYMSQYSYPQRFFMQVGGPEGMIAVPDEQEKPKFSEVIKKEPTYVAEHPFRGVAKLGSHFYGFAFDAAEPEKAEIEENAEKNADDSKKKEEPEADSKKKPQPKVATYARLYFDFNRNGDLTDDEVVKAESATQRSATYTRSSFPPIDLTVTNDGTKTDYAFTMRIYARSSGDFAYANASLNAAAYREGEITLDGKKRRVVIVDFNSNGCFNDESRINEKIRTMDGTVYPTQGDHLFVIDPDAKVERGNPYDVSASDCLHYVAGLINLGGKFYDLKITTPGDELTLSPSSAPVGHVTNVNKGYRAVVYGEEGFIKVVGDKDGKSPLPEGEWKLLFYTIDRTEGGKPRELEKEEEAAASPPGDSAKSPAPKTEKAPAPKPARPSTVSARGKTDYKPVKVGKGKTVELPFGPPYRPVVSVQFTVNQKTRQVRLGLSLVGVGDEACTDMRINGRRPDKPKFTITTKDGKEVESGAFEYG